MKRKHFYLITTILLFFLSIPTIVFAASAFQSDAEKHLNEICNKKQVTRVDAVLCYFQDSLSSLESSDTSQNTQLNALNSSVNNLQTEQALNAADIASLKTRKAILDVGQVRGSLWENTDTSNNVATPDFVTVTCPKACILWVNYDVDTRNTSAPFQHLYMMYVDGVDQAVFNQATMTVPHAAVPLAVNGVFPVNAGSHTVSIYARTYGGTMQSHESHLQVLAIEQ